MQHSEFYRPASGDRENSRSPISKALVTQWQSILRTAGISDHKKIVLICNRAKAILLIQGEKDDSSILLQAAQDIHEDETSKIRISSDSAAAVTLFATLFSDYVTRPSITEKEGEIPGGAKPTRASVHKAKRERRFDLVCEHYVAKKNQVPPSITSAADFFADSIGISRRQAKSLIYGSSSMSLERLLVLIDEGKISASGINPLILCADTPKSKWPAENLDTFFKRREAILAIREVLPWLKVHSVIEIIQNLFGISSKNHAGQVLYGCSDTDPTKVQRLEVALQSLGIDQEFITAFTKPFYLRKQSQKKEPESLKEDNSDRLLMAERRFMLERVNFELTGERETSGKVLRQRWAERIGISPKAFKPMETSKDWLDGPSSRKFARAMVELSERSMVNFNPEEMRIFIEKSVWFRRIEPNYPDALKHYRHLLLAAVSFNEVNSFLAYSGFPVAAFGQAVDFAPKAGSWDEIFLGKKHLQLSEIETLSKKLKSFEINGELGMMLSPVGIMWASPSLLQPVRGKICKAAFRHLEIKRGERNPLGISTDDRRALAHGRTWATASLLPLLTARENGALYETLGEEEGVKFLFRERLSIK